MVLPDDDPTVILSIFNYCDRRCERCPFTERCSLFKDMRVYERQHPERGPFEQVRDKFHEVFKLLERWCKHEGIDLEELQREAADHQSKHDIDRRLDEVRADPLQKLATTYMHAALKLADALSTARRLGEWPPEVGEALDTIAWHAGLVSSKIYRALVGRAENDERPADEDPVQSDWNGSAKVARILVAESRAAWEVVMKAGEAGAESPLTELVILLDRIDAGLVERFPRAMEFMRPGFDEPWLASTIDGQAT